MAQLTIIIPFLNEGNEIENTVVSIRETAVTNPVILLVNDGSDDNFDYESVAVDHNCLYIKNEKRLGSAAARDTGVAACETPYFLMLDGHMRLYEKGWDEKLIKLLAKNPRSILCGQTRVLKRNEEDDTVIRNEVIQRVTYGAYLNMEKEGLLGVKWNCANRIPHSDLVEIPCVLGAAYACNKDYWQRLLGLKGLLYYGLEEQLMSIKVWLEGGQCLLVKDFVVGHLYRKTFPYEVPNTESFYNRLFLLELLFPYSIKNDFFAQYQLVYTAQFKKAFTLLQNRYPEIKAQKDYLSTVFQNGMDYFLALNEKIQMLN